MKGGYTTKKAFREALWHRCNAKFARYLSGRWLRDRGLWGSCLEASMNDGRYTGPMLYLLIQGKGYNWILAWVLSFVATVHSHIRGTVRVGWPCVHPRRYC